MRVLMAVALFASLAFSGCAGDEPDAGEADDPGGAARRSVGGGGAAGNATPLEDVPFFEAPLRIIGQDALAFDVVVPANLTSVKARVASAGPVYQENAVAMELSGCGGFSNALVSSQGTIGASVAKSFNLCGPAAPGQQTFTVSMSAPSYVDGTIRLVGQRPVANATVSP